MLARNGTHVRFPRLKRCAVNQLHNQMSNHRAGPIHVSRCVTYVPHVISPSDKSLPDITSPYTATKLMKSAPGKDNMR